MVIKIDEKISEYRVLGENATPELNDNSRDPQQPDNVVQMNEKLERPPMLQGSTYKIKTPLSEHGPLCDHKRHYPQSRYGTRVTPSL